MPTQDDLDRRDSSPDQKLSGARRQRYLNSFLSALLFFISVGICLLLLLGQ